MLVIWIDYCAASHEQPEAPRARTPSTTAAGDEDRPGDRRRQRQTYRNGAAIDPDIAADWQQLSDLRGMASTPWVTASTDTQDLLVCQAGYCYDQRQRSVLARLVAARGQVVSADRLIEDLYAGEAPPKALAALQSYVSHLRRALEPSMGPGLRTALRRWAFGAWRDHSYAGGFARLQLDTSERSGAPGGYMLPGRCRRTAPR